MKARIVKLFLWRSSGTGSAWEAIHDRADAAAGLFAVIAACNPHASIDSITAVIRTFERLERSDALRSLERVKASWHKWVGEAIKAGARAAHQWTNKLNRPCFDVVAPNAKGPLEVVQHRLDSWASQWKANDVEMGQEAFHAVRQLRERAFEHPSHGVALCRIVPRPLREVASSFRKGTSIGADATAFQDIIETSDESLDELCNIMRSMVETLALPMQTLMVVLSLLGKKLGGTRCIAINAIFYRLLIAVMKGDVRDWDKSQGLDGDSALPGKSSVDELAWQHLLMEQAVLRGWSVVQLLWDVAKFFDCIDIPLLIQRAEEQGFPIDQLVLGMQMHRAPRVLRCN